MKKKIKTFADRAKEIQKRFPRNTWDAIERKDMLKELAKLRDEQEEYKTAMGIAEGADAQDEAEANDSQQEEQEEQAVGGNFIPGNMGSTYARGGALKYYGGFGNSFLANTVQGGQPQTMGVDRYDYNNPIWDNTGMNPYGNYPALSKSNAPVNINQPVNKGVSTIDPRAAAVAGKNIGVGQNLGYMNLNTFNAQQDRMPQFGKTKAQIIGANGIVQPGAASQPSKYQSPTTSFLPFALSGAASLIGDIAGLSNINKNMPKNVTLPRVTPQNISLQAQREALQRQYNTASNVMLRNSRDVSSPANAYANQIAGISGLTNSLGDQMGQSWMNEANQNAQFQSRASETNAQIGAREAMMNTELQGQRAQMRGQYINSMSQTVPSMFRDYRQQVNDTNMVNNMGKDYGQYEMINPNERPIDRILGQMFGKRTYTVNRDNPYIKR